MAYVYEIFVKAKRSEEDGRPSDGELDLLKVAIERSCEIYIGKTESYNCEEE